MLVIGGGVTESGRPFAAATDGATNTVNWIESGAATTWKGGEIVCCTACGETIVCSTADGVFYLVSGGDVDSIRTELDSRSIFGLCGVGVDKAVAGGSNGTLVGINVPARSATLTTALSLDLPKPGRDIINVVPFLDGIAAI